MQLKYPGTVVLLAFVLLSAPAPGYGQKISSPFSQAQFVPNISAILDFSCQFRNISDRDFQSLSLPGITLGNEEFSPRGFNLNYFELAIQSVVDPFFDLFSTFHIKEGEFAIEEAYLKTRSLPAGFQLKIGKFLSSLGRLNSLHDHVWNFSDPPLIYHALFGEGNLNELGFQLNWLAPLATYLSVGVEILKGENAHSFQNEDFTLKEKVWEKTARPLSVFFVKSSFESGNLIALYGAGLALGDIHRLQSPGDFGITADSRIIALDLTLKYLLDSYRYLNFQFEYFHRKISGDKIFSDNQIPVQALDQSHSGLYAELVFRFNRRWRTGLRVDRLLQVDDLHLNPLFPDSRFLPDHPLKLSGMLEFNPSEFSRLRLQYNFNRSRTLENRAFDLHEFFIHVNLAIGAHGAHKF